MSPFQIFKCKDGAAADLNYGIKQTYLKHCGERQHAHGHKAIKKSAS